MESLIRLKSINIKNIKNVKNGTIEIPQSIGYDGYVEKSDIIGIYGQNGSGKTTIVEAINILKTVISGEKLSEEIINLISIESSSSQLEYEFYTFVQGKLSTIKYILSLEKRDIEDEENGESKKCFVVTNEELYFLDLPREKRKRYKILASFSNSEEISPKNLKEYLTTDEESRINFKVLKNRLQFERKSLIFSKLFMEKISGEEFKVLSKFLEIIKLYGTMNLTVVENRDSGVINSNFLIPLSFRHIDNDFISHGKIGLYLNKPNELTVTQYKLVKNILEQMNIVLSKIIPGLTVTTKELSSSFNEKSMETIKFQLFSKNGENEFPLRYESDGIKKIISILSSLTVVYNNPNYCLVVDELDAGIFEYLLGEILEIVSKYGKGQLIFTSHNLRPLEILNKENLVFTTTDRKNNYTKLSNIKATNNIRNVYMKNVMLGSNEKKEELYNETDSYEIKKAFRRAGSGK
ncbi:MAG: AAA family ATPase [Cetobacterium sp.]|uniref:AAA family ATPase n=1 Tax=Cetobacterium sp. TaxID=2071632 RepID=UPI003F328CB5